MSTISSGIPESKGATPRVIDFGKPSPTLHAYLTSILGGLSGEWIVVADFDPSKKPGETGRIVHRWRRSVKELRAAVDGVEDRNLYFAHARFSERQRKDEHVVSTRIIFTDHDTPESVAALRRFPVYPSWVVHTSPGKRQAVWVVRDPKSPEEMAEITRRLVRLLGADKGVWEPSRLLRLPWTLNVKPEYGPDYPLVELEGTGRVVDLSRLTRHLPDERKTRTRPSSTTALRAVFDPHKLLAKLPHEIQQVARGFDKDGDRVPKGERSEAFKRVAMTCFEKGWSRDAVEAVARYANEHLMAGRYSDEQIESQLDKFEEEFGARLDTEIVVHRADLVVVRQVDWLWQDHVPLRKVTIFDGDPEMGKSTIAEADLAARVTRGWDMPDGSDNPFDGEPRDVVIMTAEDDYDDTLVPRLMAAGADLSRVHFLEGPRDEYGSPTNLRLPNDLNKIRRTCKGVRDKEGRPVGLIVVDPVIAFFDAKVNSWSDQQARPVIGALRDVAQDFDCAVVAIRHFKKEGANQKILHRGGGTVGIIAAARAGIGVVDHPDDPELKVFGNTKSNLGPKTALWSYKIEGAEVEAAGLTLKTSKIVWVGPVEGYRSLDDLLTTPPNEQRQPRTSAREWLLRSLPMRSEDMQVLADAEGLSWVTVRRARSELKEAGFIDRRKIGGSDGYWEWYLVEGREDDE
jgi:hypothetical protein